MQRTRTGTRTAMRTATGACVGLAVAALDLVTSTSVAGILWVTGRTSVIDPPLVALLAAVVVGGFLVALRLLMLRWFLLRTGAGGPLLVERTTIAAWVVLLAGGAVWWRVSGVYELGWGTAFAAVAALVGSTLLLLCDVLTGSRRRGTVPGTTGSVSARWTGSVELLHIGAAAAGVVGIVVTAPIHEWRGDVLNGSILVVGAVVATGRAALTLPRSRRPDPASSISSVGTAHAVPTLAPPDGGCDRRPGADGLQCRWQRSRGR